MLKTHSSTDIAHPTWLRARSVLPPVLGRWNMAFTAGTASCGALTPDWPLVQAASQDTDVWLL